MKRIAAIFTVLFLFAGLTGVAYASSERESEIQTQTGTETASAVITQQNESSMDASVLFQDVDESAKHGVVFLSKDKASGQWEIVYEDFFESSVLRIVLCAGCIVLLLAVFFGGVLLTDHLRRRRNARYYY